MFFVRTIIITGASPSGTRRRPLIAESHGAIRYPSSGCLRDRGGICLTSTPVYVFSLTTMKHCYLPLCLIAGLTNLLCSNAIGASTRPAMVGTGGDSFAAQLHYPQKAKASRQQAAIPFYCEIGADGKPTHIHTLDYKGKTEFTDMVDHALRKSHFQPAMVN